MGQAGYQQMVLTVITAFVGLFAIIILSRKGVRAAVLLGMLIASVVYWIGDIAVLGGSPFASLSTASWVPPVADMASQTLFKFNFSGFMQLGWFTAVTLILTFCMIAHVRHRCTLVGSSVRAGWSMRTATCLR